MQVVSTVKDSYSTLFRNRTVLAYVVIIAIVSSILVGSITSLTGVSPGVASASSLAAAYSNIALLAAVAVISFLVSVFLAGAVLTAAQAGWKGGLADAARNSLSRYLSVLGADLLGAVIIAVPFVAFYLFGLLVVLSSVSLVSLIPFAFGILLILIGVILLALFGVRFSISMVGAINGNMRAVQSVKHSWHVTKGNYWRILAVFLVIGIIMLVVGDGLVIALGQFGLSVIGYFVLALLSGAGSVAIVRIYEALPG